AEEWRDRRRPRFPDQVRSLADAVRTGAPVADLGSGPGLHLAFLPRPAIAIDAAPPMGRLVRETAPAAWPCQAHLRALPLRRGSLGGGGARVSYRHARHERLPLAFACLHHALEVGAPVHLVMHAGQESGTLADDDFPGRWFAAWGPDALADVMLGAGFDI